MEIIPEKQTFASSAIYKVLLPKNRLLSVWKTRKEKDNILLSENSKSLTPISHVMFEAQIIDFRGNKAIAVYLRDMTYLMKVRKLK